MREALFIKFFIDITPFLIKLAWLFILNSNLGGIRFGVDSSGSYGYIKAGADTVTPFSSDKNYKITINYTSTAYPEVFYNDGYHYDGIYGYQQTYGTKVIYLIKGKLYNDESGTTPVSSVSITVYSKDLPNQNFYATFRARAVAAISSIAIEEIK